MPSGSVKDRIAMPNAGGYGEAEVVQPDAFGVEPVAGVGDRSQPEQHAACGEHDAAVELVGVAPDSGVGRATLRLRDDGEAEDVAVERAGAFQGSDGQPQVVQSVGLDSSHGRLPTR